jgi:hypothetical protein
MALGLTLLYFAFLGKFANANEFLKDEERPNNSMAKRRTELAPQAADAYAKVYQRMQRPLVIVGCTALLAGIVILLIGAFS